MHTCACCTALYTMRVLGRRRLSQGGPTREQRDHTPCSRLLVLTQGSVVRSKNASSRTIGSGSVGATFQLAATFGGGRSGGMPNAIVISLTSEARRARPPIRSWERGHPPYGLIECAAARIGTWACKKRRTRSIVRCFSSSGSFHGYTVISAFGAGFVANFHLRRFAV